MDDYYYYEYRDGDGDDHLDVGEDYDTDTLHERPQLADELHSCILPSLTQVSTYVAALLFWNLILRIAWTSSRRLLGVEECVWMQHLASMALGFAALYFNTGHDFLVVVFLSLVAYVLMLVLQYRKSRNMGVVVAIASIGAQFLYELLWNQPEMWHRIRGLQMVATMKIVSLAFDLDATVSKQPELLQNRRPQANMMSGTTSVPALVPYLGYIVCPANSVAGPWLPYAAYLQSMRVCGGSVFGFKGRAPWLLWSTLNAVLAVCFLCLSNCVVPLLCSERAWLWLRTYRDALAVRCSHYFISFLSQATTTMAGVASVKGTPSNAWLGPTVVSKPWCIEFPRSLSALVRCWNIPMHDWLKTYIYRPAQQRFGSYLAAVLCTYLVSSLLHGIYLKIYLVLLSLACFAHVETLLRAKLADIFNACIAASGCRGSQCHFSRCPRRLGWRSWAAATVMLVNFMFGALAVLHLAYLGVMMNDFNVDDEDVGTTANAGLWNWSRLGYLSHWVGFASYVFYYLI